jgi:glycogen debranching enzyme
VRFAPFGRVTIAHVRPGIVYAWKGPSLLILSDRGECAAEVALSGLYYREARFLDTLRLEINGRPPWLCECAAVAPDRVSFAYVHPEVAEFGGGGTGQSGDDEPRDERGIPQRSLDLRVEYHIGVSSLEIAIAVGNRALMPIPVDLALVCGADFADIQEANAGRREQQAEVAVSGTENVLTFAYQHARLPYRTAVRAPEGWTAEGDRVRVRVTLAPQESAEWILSVAPETGQDDPDAAGAAARDTALRRWQSSFATIAVPGNRAVEDVLSSNIRDAASFPLLDGPPGEWLAMQAGMPMYPAFFGRDAVTAGWQAAMLDAGASLEAALARLARMQSNRVDDWRDEQPGRIPYQMRTGPLAALGLNPYAAYYADFASPLMYVIALANLYAWTGERGRIAPYWDTARRILDWARDRGDADRDGYLEYCTRSSNGTKNQGWKDSGDAIMYDDGRLVPAPIATCELQGYWFVAQELMALLSAVMNEPGDAAAHWRSAAALKARFNRDWWVEADRFYALALDPEKRQVRAVTSNVGHCLACGIIDRDRIPAVVGRLFAPDLFSGWGIRTLSSDHAYYNPVSYHRGTVWAVEQATIVFGLRRFGCDARALDLARALFDLARLYPEHRIPECVGGYARGSSATPGAYPRANTPQLWNASAFPLIVQSLLGLIPFAAAGTLVIDPVLPEWMPDVVVRGLRVGGAVATIRFRRDERGRSTWDVLHKTGTLHVVRQPPPESLSAGLAARAHGLLETATA